MVSLFNGIIIFVGYLIPKHPSRRIAEMLFNTKITGNKGFHAFKNGIGQKVLVIAVREFELQDASHNAKGSSAFKILLLKQNGK